MQAGPWGPHRRGLMCRGFPESLVRGALGARTLGWAPGLGEDCREMKEGSLQSLLERAAAKAASWRDGASWSKEAGGDEEEEEQEEEEAFKDEGEADPPGERGGAASAAAVRAGELGVCLVGRWAAEGFLGPWLAEALLLAAASLGPGAGAVAARRLWRFWVRWSSWHWAPRGHAPLRAKSGHSRVCFFLHFAPRGQ